MRTILLTLTLLLAVEASSRVTAARPDDVDFNRDIRPILSDKCFQCHGPDAEHREADLRFDLEESAKADLGGYRAIVPGRPGESALVERVTATDPETVMPPPDSGKTLTDAQVKLLETWIASGAKWSRHWAYVAPQRHKLPAVADANRPANWIDRFVLDRLQRENLSPSPAADRHTLIRRLHFDLVGLPPTPAEVDDFVNDRRVDAYDRLVQRLLDSDRFGERMAMYWLDLVRYADSVGYHGDQEHAITPYRDWVIAAFNRNKPFDQFTREQIAGDLIAARDAESLSNDEVNDLKIASGYNRLLQTSHEGGVQQKEYLAIYQADRIRNLSAVWLGATLGCCQCHDHKYDPFTATDFYSLGAMLADIDDLQTFRGSNTIPTKRAPELTVLSPLDRDRVQQLEQQIAAADPAAAAALKKERDAIKPRRTMITVAVNPRPIRLLPRGNWLDDSGPVMQPAVPAFLGKLATAERATRLDLADWLVTPASGGGVDGLTARVHVNRFWYLLFGTGIASVLDDFGGQGEPPVHPELLDNLAIEFVESGWDVKQLLRTIVASRTYRQSSIESAELRERDPYNRLYARQSRWRLPAESVRDTALAVSGLLVNRLGGDSVRPYQPAGYYRHLNFPQRKYRHDDNPNQWRRGVYVHWQRQFLHPMMRAFDAPSREECSAQRPRSNTPLAALTMMNDPTMVEASRAFAQRILREAGREPQERVAHAWRRATSREPTAEELQVLVNLARQHLTDFQDDPQSADRLSATGRLPAPDDLDRVELAAWTSVTRAILNLNETITRN